MPVQQIRDYYGEEVAIYFEYMNFFLRWMAFPAIFGFVAFLYSEFFTLPEDSFLCALFAICMSIWAALFSINWKKHERSLSILWDNLYNSEHRFQ